MMNAHRRLLLLEEGAKGGNRVGIPNGICESPMKMRRTYR